MSRRLILQTTPKLLTTTTTRIHHAPCYLLSLASHSNATIFRGQIRTITKRSQMARRIDRMQGAVITLSPEAYNKVLEEARMKHRETAHLLYAIRWRLSGYDIRCLRSVRFIHDCLRNLEAWLSNPTKIPKAYQHSWDSQLANDRKYNVDLHKIGSHSDEVIGKACRIIGLDMLSQAQAKNDISLMSFGCFMLELAVLFGRWEAAANLLNYHNDPLKASLLLDASVDSDIRVAEDLIQRIATQNPRSAPPGALLVYLRAQYSPKKITSLNPFQLQWGYTVSNLKVPRLSILEDTMPFDVYPHPAQIRLQILEHCMSKNIALSELPLEKMPEAREQALVQLAAVNDPRACMIFAARENGPAMYSKDWERLLLAAAAGGIPQACRLLSYHYMRKEGILPIGPDSKEKLKTSLGLEFGRICILALVETPRDFELYTLALAALCKKVDDDPRGLMILEDSLVAAESESSFPRADVAKMREHIKDYKKNDTGWGGHGNENGINTKLHFLEPDSFMKKVRNAYQ